MTLLEVLRSTTVYFQKRALESPRLNAEHLLAHSLGKKRLELYLDFDRPLSEAELAPLRELVRRRGQGEPLQHLLGTVEFCGHSFLCDQRALIPRPETEELVELLIAELGTPNAEFAILDVGTGSGVIAVSLAARFPEAEVHAIDISESALALAHENAARLGLVERVHFQQSDLLHAATHTYDLIVANLPYVPDSERASVAREVAHDPEIALFAAEDGQAIIRKLIEDAPANLKPDGLLALEVGIAQADAFAACLTGNGYHDISARQDYAGVTRFLLARYG